MRLLKKSRRQLFDEIERAALKPCRCACTSSPSGRSRRSRPTTTSPTTTTSTASTSGLIGQQLDLRATEATIEIFKSGKRLESYPRSYAKGKYTTRKEHMPRDHRDHAEWTPERIAGWAKKSGPQTVALVEAIMASKVHPQQGFKRCLGILRLGKEYTPEASSAPARGRCASGRSRTRASPRS